MLWCMGLCTCGCQMPPLAKGRDWNPDQAVLPRAEIAGGQVTVRNVRNCQYFTADEYVVQHDDRTLDVANLVAVDFIVVPFAPDERQANAQRQSGAEGPQNTLRLQNTLGLQNAFALAHTMLSFDFGDQGHLAVSAEVRKERGEKFDPVRGLLGQYELMYVVGDERDLIGQRAGVRRNDVFVYRTKATPAQAQALFLDVMHRVNKLHEQPEFYHTLLNNCSTNIAQHVNRLRPGSVPTDYRLLLTGYSDSLAYELGLLDTALPFEQARQRANVSELARQYQADEAFSRKIRR